MADEVEPDGLLQPGAREPEAEAAAQRESSDAGRKERSLGRPQRRLARPGRWLRSLDQIREPIVLRPRGVRLLVLLILGNLVMLGLLTWALYRASMMLAAVQLPLPSLVPVKGNPSPLPTPGPTPTPLGSGGAIAFTLRRDGNADIYALNQAERQLVRLTYNQAEDREPAWSPDGKYIAFSSNRAHNWDIYLLDLASGALIRLTHDPGFDAHPSWSSDGEWIAFESYRYGNLDIYAMSPDGKQERRVTTSRAPDFGPAWSPDSHLVAFTSFRDGTKDIYVIPFDGEGELTNVTQTPDMDETDPAWSPDGTRLAYVSGPSGNPSVQVTPFDWDMSAGSQAETELFGAGISPTWAPDAQSLIHVYERGGRSHLVVASMTGWALFHEVYSTDGLLDDLAWADEPLSPRVVAQAQAAEPTAPSPLYLELVQPTPTADPRYRLIALPKMGARRQHYLSDRVNESFNALRERVVEEAGWDYLGEPASTTRPMTYTPPSGHSRMSWHLCGRAFGLDQDPYESDDPQVELIRQDVGNVTYWRVYLRASKQDGSMGEPLHEAPWDLNARQEGGRSMVEGGAPRARIPPGYYVDFTTLASSYGWERVPSLWRWRYFWADIRWWEFQKTDGLSWWACMLEIFEPKRIERTFGPIPGYDE